jgi:hypothetical protein
LKGKAARPVAAERPDVRLKSLDVEKILKRFGAKRQ